MGPMDKLQTLLGESTQRHTYLCPRQILGVRMGLYAGNLLGLYVPQSDKRLYTFAESDGCGTGGISVATGCWVDRRTMKVFDFGKLAATFVDTQTGKAVRIIPHPESRTRAQQFCSAEPDPFQCMIAAYQVMPEEDLFLARLVALTISMEKVISQSGYRVDCELCGEEIMNQREIQKNGKNICRGCAGEAYYQDIASPIHTQKNALTRKTCHGSTPLVTIIGKSGSGKTTFMEKLIPIIVERGYRVGTVKHHSHSGFDIDRPGKDSWRHAQAGSQHVIIAAPDKIATYRQLERELTLDEITTQIDGVDIILVEGYKQANKPAVEVVRGANSFDLIGSQVQRIAVAADITLDVSVPQYDLNDAMGVASLIEKSFLKNDNDLV